MYKNEEFGRRKTATSLSAFIREARKNKSLKQEVAEQVGIRCSGFPAFVAVRDCFGDIVPKYKFCTQIFITDSHPHIEKDKRELSHMFM